MVDRRKFIQTCLLSLAAVSMSSTSCAKLLEDRTPHPCGQPDDKLPAVLEPVQEGTLVGGRQIKLIGVGGGGSNAAWHMIDSGVSSIEYIFANTDMNALKRCAAHKTIQLHRKTLSARTKHGRCRQTAELATNDIRSAINGADMLFITVGMGGGTGTEAAPVIARIAKEMGIHTVAVVTMPFSWEGVRRMKYADNGVVELQAYTDTLVVIPNDRLLEGLGEDVCVDDAFCHVNERL